MRTLPQGAAEQAALMATRAAHAAVSALAPFIRKTEDEYIFKQLSSLGAQSGMSTDVKVYVGVRLDRLRTFFPLASAKQLCDALQYYSPESYLVGVLGHPPVLPIDDSGQWEKYQGKLEYGSEQSFHGGVERVIGAALSSGVKPGDKCHTCGHRQTSAGVGHTVEQDIFENGSDDDKYNLWYFKYCKAREQQSYDEKGEPRMYDSADEGQTAALKVLDAGHEGWTLKQFVAHVNGLLKKAGTDHKVTDEEVLTLRMYTGSTFWAFNNALRKKGMSLASGADDYVMPVSFCIQAARNGLLKMQSIPREQCSTYRGCTGFVDEEFNKQKIGLEFAFLSASTDRKVAENFAKSAEKWVLFEVLYVAACSGVDLRCLSVYPGEKEILFPPCTALNKVGEGSAETRVTKIDGGVGSVETTGVITVSPTVTGASSQL
jgi:hypothetical protein